MQNQKNLAIILIATLVVVAGGLYIYVSSQGKIATAPVATMDPSWDANRDGINDCEKDGTCDDSVDYSKPKMSKMDPSWDADGDGINDCQKEGTCDDAMDYSKPKNTVSVNNAE